jgi:hypothetical protein
MIKKILTWKKKGNDPKTAMSDLEQRKVEEENDLKLNSREGTMSGLVM